MVLGHKRIKAFFKLKIILVVGTLFISACGVMWIGIGGANSGVGTANKYQLVFTSQPSNTVVVGATLPIGGTIQVQDMQGNLISSGPVSTATIIISDSSGNGNLAGITNVTAVGGVATVPNNALMFERGGTKSILGNATVTGFGNLTGSSASVAVTIPSFSTVSNFSGVNDPSGDHDATGISARIWYPEGLVASGGNIYIQEGYPACVIRKYNIGTGAVTTWAGQLYNCGTADGVAGANTLSWNTPYSFNQMATDGTNLYFINNNCVRMANIASGTVTTIAGGCGSYGYLDNATGTSALFANPSGLYLKGATLYMGDNNNYRIRSISTASPYAVNTYAGNGTQGLVDNANPLLAEIYGIQYLAGDATNLYLLDSNNIRQIAWAGGAVATKVTSAGGCVNWGNFPTAAVLGTSFYLSCGDSIKSATIGAWAAWSTVAGGGGAGAVDGGVGTSLLGGDCDSSCGNVGLFPSGTNIYFADNDNGTLRVLDNTNTVTTLAGTPNAGKNWTQNTSAANSRFGALVDAVSDGTTLFAADWTSNAFAAISLSNGSTGNAISSADYTAETQQLAMVGSTLYYMGNCQIWSVNPYTATSSSLAGNDSNCGNAVGNFSSAQFNNPSAIISDQQFLYVFDQYAIKKLNLSTQTVSVLSGSPGTYGCTTGSAASSLFGQTASMTYLNGNIYFSTSCNNGQVIQVNTTTGVSSVYAGNGIAGFNNGVLANAEFAAAMHMTTDGVNLYLYDAYNGMIREINVGLGTVSTIYGSQTARWQLDGPKASAQEGPTGVGPGSTYRSLYYGYGKLYIIHEQGVRVVQ